MKILFVKKILPAFALALSLLCLASCQGVVYDNIRKEVELESGNIAGDIRAIVRFKDKYYIANGGIYYKDKTWNFYGAWIPTASPMGQVLKLAADKKYLYALVGISAENEKEGTNVGQSRALYYSEDGINWQLIKGLGVNGYILYNSKAIIYTYLLCTNSIKEDNRSAYFVLNDGTAAKTQNKAYRLDGPNVAEMELGTGLNGIDEKPFSTINLVSRSCVWFDGKVYFFNSNASTTNETEKTAPTIFYYGLGSYLRWGGAQKNEVGIMCRDTLQSLGVTADYILVGTNSGITHHPLVSGIPGASVDFITNAAATLSGAYRILALLVVSPELKELQTPIYASQVYAGTGASNSAQFDHVGLWAYYPARGNWNRE